MGNMFCSRAPHGRGDGHESPLLDDGLGMDPRLAGPLPANTPRMAAMRIRALEEELARQDMALQTARSVIINREKEVQTLEEAWRVDVSELQLSGFIAAGSARRSSAEHLIATKALRCTAMAWIFIPAYCFAIP